MVFISMLYSLLYNIFHLYNIQYIFNSAHSLAMREHTRNTQVPKNKYQICEYDKSR